MIWALDIQLTVLNRTNKLYLDIQRQIFLDHALYVRFSFIVPSFEMLGLTAGGSRAANTGRFADKV